MNDLVIQTNSYTPAKVDFNYQQIADQLEVVLDKYKGLVFTEETAADCKKTITDLRKGKKAVEDFRKETKAKLSESIVEFENKCKLLSTNFDSVILPLTQQADIFEVNRKEEKRVKVQEIIDKLITEYELDEKYREELIVLDSFLGSSISIKKITESLTEIATRLKAAQDQEKSYIELVTSIVERVNIENEMNMIPDPYIELLAYMNTNQVVARIYEDVAKVKEAKEREILRVAEAQQRAELNKLREEQELKAALERIEIAVEPLIKVTEIEDAEEYIQELLPFEPVEEIEETREYKVTATIDELDQLEKYLNGNFREWENTSLGF